ncbi:MAG: VIT1/CCC1 transporter family protein [Thermodesulfobacteriota bacterium]
MALFFIGALRTVVTRRAWWRAGLEMTLIGGSAAAIAWLIGRGVSHLG